jgi:hypothetical protein
MKKNFLHIRFLIGTALLLFACLNEAGSQGIDINAGNKKGFFLGLNISPLKTSIVNGGSGSVANNVSSPETSVSSSIDLGYSFSKNFGISTGIGFIVYSGNLTLGTYSINYDTIDSETDSYKRYIDGHSIYESQKITFLTIPFALNIDIPVSEKIGFYIQPGINFLITVNSAFDNSGTFNYEGYYTKYNVRVSDIPYEGFKDNFLNIGDGELMINSFNYEFITSAGVQLSLNKKLKLIAGVEYHKVLSDISAYSTESSFRLTTKPDHMNSLMAGSDDVSADAFGVRIGVRYFIK